MAVTLGISSGFVKVAPTADPNGGATTTIDGSSVVTKDTSPRGATKIIEIGWYRAAGTNASNFEVALYADSTGVAGTRLFVDNTNSSTSSGWIVVAVDWSISENTPYWLAVQMDSHSGSSSIDRDISGGSGYDILTSQTTLNDPYGGGAVTDADGLMAIYALVNVIDDNQPIYLIGKVNLSDNQSVYLSGNSTITDTQSIYLNGLSISSSDNQPIYLNGSAVTTDNQPMYLKGMTVNSFLDHFDSTLDSRWTQVTSGNGSVNITNSYLRLQRPTTGDAAYVYYNTSIDITKSQVWWFSSGALNSGGWRRVFMLRNTSTPGTPLNYEDNNTVIISQIALSTNYYLTLDYWNTSGQRQTWREATADWGTPTYDSNNRVNLDHYVTVGLEIDGPGSRFRLIGYTANQNTYSADQGQKIFQLTSWVNWSSAQTAKDNLYLFLGVPYNTNANSDDNRIEFVKYEDNNKKYAWVNGRNLSTSNYNIRKFYTLGDKFIPFDRTTIDINIGGGGEWDQTTVKDPMVVQDGRTMYMFYDGQNTYFQIGVASSTDGGITWTKYGSNPIIARSAGDEDHISFPYVVKDDNEPDSNKRWKMLYSGFNISSSTFKLFYAYASTPLGTWTKHGTAILTAGTAGAFDDEGCNNPVFFRHKGKWEVWYAGFSTDAVSGEQVYSTGRATGNDLTSLTKDGNGARITWQSNGIEASSGAINGNIITMSDTTGFIKDATVALTLDNVADNWSIAKIKNVNTNTSLELYETINFSGSTQVIQVDAWRGLYLSHVEYKNGTWYFYGVVFKPFEYSTSYSAAVESSVLWTHAGVDPWDTTPVMDSFNHPNPPLTGFAFDTSSENIGLITTSINDATTSSEDAQSIFLTASSIIIDNQSIYLDAVIAGTNINDTQIIYLKSSDIISDNQSIFIKGMDIISDNQSLFVSGQSPSIIDIQSNEGHLSFINNTNAYARAIGYATDTQDVESILKFKFGDLASGGTFRAFIRSSADWADWQTPTTAYEIAISNTGNYIVNRIQSGSRTQIGSQTQSIGAGYYWLKFQAVGTQIRAKIWTDGAGEPGWQQDIDDSVSGFTTPGTLQLGYFRVAGSHELFIDDLSYSTPTGSHSDNTPIFLKGQSSLSNNQTIYLKGQDSSLDNQIIYLKGISTLIDTQSIYIKGSIDITDTQIIFLTASGVGLSDTQTIYLKGLSTLADSQAVYLDGQDSLTDTQLIYLEGSAGLTDNQSINLHGAYMPFTDDFTGTDSIPWDSDKWVKEITGGGALDISSNRGRLYRLNIADKVRTVAAVEKSKDHYISIDFIESPEDVNLWVNLKHNNWHPTQNYGYSYNGVSINTWYDGSSTRIIQVFEVINGVVNLSTDITLNPDSTTGTLEAWTFANRFYVKFTTGLSTYQDSIPLSLSIENLSGVVSLNIISNNTSVYRLVDNVYISKFCLNRTPIYLKGQSILTDNQVIYLKAENTSTDNQTIYLKGRDSLADTQSIYLDAENTSIDNQVIYLKGSSTLTDSQNIYLRAENTLIDSLNIYLKGLSTLTDTQIIYLLAGLSISDTQLIFLTASGNPIIDNQIIYLKGISTLTDTQNIYLKGTNTSSDTQTIYLKSQGILTDNLSIYINATSADVIDSQSIYIKGQSTLTDSQLIYLKGSINVTNNKAIFLTASGNVSIDNQVIYLKGLDNLTDTQTIYLQGRDTATDTQSIFLTANAVELNTKAIYLKGLDTFTNNKEIYLRGKLDISNNISIYLNSIDILTDTQTIYTKGKDTLTNTQSIYIKSELGIISTQELYLKGLDTLTNNNSIYLKGALSLTNTQTIYLYGTYELRDTQKIYLRAWSGYTIIVDKNYLIGKRILTINLIGERNYTPIILTGKRVLIETLTGKVS